MHSQPSRRRLFAVSSVVVLLAASAVWPGLAAKDSDDKKKSEQAAVREALRRGEILPLAKILAIVAVQVPGEVIKVELDRDDDKMIYEIKVLADSGRVREIELDARSGEVIKIEDD